MDARKVAAQFAAYAWYLATKDGKECPEEAARFARENWGVFEPVANDGWGRLLLQVLSPRRNPCRRRQVRVPSLIGAG